MVDTQILIMNVDLVILLVLYFWD